MLNPRSVRTRAAIALMVSLGAVASTTGVAQAASQPVNVVGYSVVGPVFSALETAFAATPAGQGVSFSNSFGASDTQTNNVAAGQPADLVNLSYEPNIQTLVDAGKVPANWPAQEGVQGGVQQGTAHSQTVLPTQGIVTDSAVVFVVRKGNPNGYTDWNSLVTKKAQIVTPNPTTSGSARWNLMAAYSSQIQQHKTPAQATQFLRQIIAQSVAQPTSGSASLAAFLSGTGTVLLSYEDDALAAIAKGKPIQIVMPPQTIEIENPVALTTTGLKNPSAVAFYHYLFTPAAQTIFAANGFRPVLKSVWATTKSTFVAPASKQGLQPIAYLYPAGWDALNTQFFGSTVRFAKNNSSLPISGIVTYLEQFAGTAS